MESKTFIPWQVEVFTLSTRVWRGLSSSNFPCNLVRCYGSQVYVDGVLYWLASDKVNGILRGFIMIVSFDLTSEEFRQVYFPDNLAPQPFGKFSMYKLRETLAVIEPCVEDSNLVHHVWMMEKDDVTRSFKKLYTISNHSPDVSIVGVCGFRKTGEALIELETHPGSTKILAAYDPYSKAITNLGINGRNFSLYSYMETLVLL
ncbi:putative F-box associated interaction domain-containing protein [Helianthus anomalus]